MDIQKAFVIKNSLEVDRDLIIANSDTRKVGIGTSQPSYLLDVAGGIGVTYIYATGVSTFVGSIQVGTNPNTLIQITGSSIGIGTTIPKDSLDIKGNIRASGFTSSYQLFSDEAIVGVLTVTSGFTIESDASLEGNLSIGGVGGNLNSVNLNVTGISTLATLSRLNVVGPSTISVSTSRDALRITQTGSGNALLVEDSTNPDSTPVVIDNSGKVGIGTTIATSTLDVRGGIAATSLLVSGVSTFAGVTTVTGTTLFAKQLEVAGVSTFIDDVTIEGTVGFTSNINTNLIPSANGTYNIGSDESKWNSVYANAYENFKLTDLPVGANEEPSFLRDRILKVKSDSSGYELVNILDLNTYLLRSFNISNDPTVYVGIGSTVNNRLQISGVSTSRFYVGEKVKVFGISSATDNTFVDPPSLSGCLAEKAGNPGGNFTMRYWVAQYDYSTGKVGVSSQITPTAGLSMPAIYDFNDIDNVQLTLSRTDINKGLLVYRQIGITTNINEAKLIAILGPKELSNSTSDISWTDYGTFDQVEWTSKGTVNEFVEENQIHFPNIATTGHRRGWAIEEIVSIGQSSITVNGNYKTNIGIGTTAAVKVVHDNTYAINNAIDNCVSIGKNFLEFPSGTYLTNKLILPNGFTIKGTGRNTVIKQQYFSLDSEDGGGNFLTFDGNMVGIGTTNPTDITLQDITFDGNKSNNILFENESDNYLLYFEGVNSSLIKDVEIRNTPGHGLYIYDTKRLSVENCSVVDGSETDRYTFYPINAQESETLRVNDCLFENYSGAVDFSVSSVVSTGGNIIRNCGTGLRIYAAGKISTSNNIILGPSDEYIPTPDIYDSDFNSVNLTVKRGTNFESPVYLYLENGTPKNLSSAQVSIAAGIGTIVNEGQNNEYLSEKFLNFNIVTPDTGGFGRQSGYVQLALLPQETSNLGVTSTLAYDIIGTEFRPIPPGFSTSIFIGIGTWSVVGSSSTEYFIKLNDPDDFTGISTGDVIKLIDHSVTPDISTRELLVEEKIDEGVLTKKLRTTLNSPISSAEFVDGNQTGYITIRNIFTIAQGRVGVTN